LSLIDLRTSLAVFMNPPLYWCLGNDCLGLAGRRLV
jgi:hypothetical protein